MKSSLNPQKISFLWTFIEFYLYHFYKALITICFALFLTFYQTPRTKTTENMFSSVQLLSRVWLFVTPWTAAYQASLSITNSRSSLKLMSIESVMPSRHLIHMLADTKKMICLMWPSYCDLKETIKPYGKPHWNSLILNAPGKTENKNIWEICNLLKRRFESAHLQPLDS